ncbi:MAG: aspartate aminotransferase, partial [Pseudomonadales bacterium]|nr:aspartate aminotransferase [Pseudomonadales bacterium]
WHAGLLDYLAANRDLLQQAVDRMPGVAMSPVEATYLAWLDVREVNVDDPLAFFEGAGVGLSDGKRFRGEGFLRFNFGCPRSMLIEALARMDRALSGPGK